MGGTTNSQALRYPYIDETITDVSTKNLADDIAAKLTVEDGKRTLALKRYSASANRSAVQAIADTTNVTVIFDNELWDPDGMINLGLQPTRVTVPAVGLYYVNAHCFQPGGTTWNLGQISILKNGTLQCRRRYWGDNATTAGPLRLQVTGLIYCSAISDFFEMQLFHIGGGTTNASVMELTVRRVTS